MKNNSYFSVNNQDMPQDLLKSMKKNASNSKDDPRLKNYQDSLTVYNKGIKLQKDMKTKLAQPWSELKKYNSLDDIMKRKEELKRNKIKPIGETSVYYVKDDDGAYASHPKYTNQTMPVYKKPTQPVNKKTEPSKVEVKQVKGGKKYFINETEVDEPTFNKIAPIKSMKKNEK
jgi:hypothetical protein